MEKKPKGKKRVEMEEVHGPGGMDTDRRREYFTCLGNEWPSMDALGRVSFH